MIRYHHGREDADPSSQRMADAATDAPEDMVQVLMRDLRKKFYAAADEKRWFQDQKALMMTLTWPATWLNERGIGLPVDRYNSIIREIIAGIERHGDVAAIKHFPTYFAHTVRQWFVHQGEELYEERKRMRPALP